MLDLIPTLLGAIAAVLGVTAFIMRKNWLETKALLADTTIRYEAALQQFQKSENGSRSSKEQIEKFRQQAQKAEKTAEELKGRSQEGRLESVRLKTELEGIQAKFDSQKEHLLEQITVLTSQLSENVREKKAALDEANTLRLQMDDKAREQSEGLRIQLNELHGKLVEAKRDRSSLQTQIDKLKNETGLVKPEELRRWQLKVARLEQLYASMKGLREMAEERNENWETALRYFAAHVLGRKMDALQGASIGALVGEALEKIGATLVNDDEEQAAPYAKAEAEAETPPATLS
ncbi:MAG: hypothetical protein V4655_08590 [Bdellovibrionota bacterium]